MADGSGSGDWAYRSGFAAIAALSLFARILPLSTLPAGWPGPDLLVCLAFAWILRRPTYVPALLIASVVFIEDLVLLRPPGLWAFIVLIGSEFLRRREPLSRQLPFPLEWAMVAVVLVLMMATNRLIMAIVASPQPDFGFAFIQTILTIALYPAIVVLSHLAFGVRKSATGEVDKLGRRL